MANSLQVDKNQVVAGLGTFTYDLPFTTAGVAEATDITVVADVAGSLNSTFFNFWTGNDRIAYYVWFNVNSAGVDPAPAGKTGIQVALATGDTANTVATQTRAAITTTAGAYVTVTGATSHVIITNKVKGATTNAANGTASPGFSYSVSTAGVTGIPSNVILSVDVQSTLPQSSALTAAIKLDSQTVVSNGGSASDPTPTQPSIGCSAQLICNGGDTISVVLSSANNVDTLPGSVKTNVNIVTVYAGA